METLLLLTYASICWIIFKIFKIPVNKWSLTTVVLGGIVILGTLLAGMAYFHPASQSARTYFITTPIVSSVRGKVIKVNARANEPLLEGDVLFEIDPTPYQGEVDNIQAQLDFARKRLQQSRELVKAAGGSKFDVEKYEKEVKSLQGQLDVARFNLDSCTVRAPSNGFVTHVRVRPGQMAVPFPVAPVMTFVNTDATAFVAGFTQEPMQNIKEGNHAEVLFPGIPGRVFQAHVEKIMPALAEGELSPDRAMVSLSNRLPQGQIPVIIKIDDDLSNFFIPMGSDAMVAVYSKRWHHVTIIRKVLLRMQSWRNFLHFH
jgi:multidrug resistance efflux pump